MIRLLCTHLKNTSEKKEEKKKKEEKIERLNIRLFISPGDHVKKKARDRERKKKVSRLKRTNQKILDVVFLFFRRLAYELNFHLK